MADIIQKCEIRKLLIWVIGQGSVCSSCLPQPLLTHPWAASQPVSLPGSPPAFLLPFLGSPLLAPTAGGQWHMKCMRNIIGVYNANYLSRQHLTKAWVWHGKKKKAIWKFRQHNLSAFILYTQMKEGISKRDLYWAVLLDLPEPSSWRCSKSQQGRHMGRRLGKAFLQEFPNFAENLKTSSPAICQKRKLLLVK